MKILSKKTWLNMLAEVAFLKLVVYRHQLFIRLLGNRIERLKLELLWAGRDWE